MNHNDISLIETYCTIDDFVKEFIKINGKLLSEQSKIRNRQSSLSLSEIMTIMVIFHTSGYRDFKHFYILEKQAALKQAFPGVVSYNRMIELMQTAVVPLALFLYLRCMGQCTGISFMDSTSVSVCDNHRIHNNKVFRGLAARGKTTMGWFYGFKLHLVINEKGELLSFEITKGNVDDRDRTVIRKMTKKLFGKIFADKGYVGQELFEMLFDNGVQLITKLKKNMKGKIMHAYDRIMLRKRSLIETVNDELKNVCQIEHTRHRSPVNWLGNLLSGLVAYTFRPKKPALNLDFDFEPAIPAGLLV